MLLSLSKATRIAEAREASETASAQESAGDIDIDAMTPEQRFAYVAAYDGEQ